MSPYDSTVNQRHGQVFHAVTWRHWSRVRLHCGTATFESKRLVRVVSRLLQIDATNHIQLNTPVRLLGYNVALVTAVPHAPKINICREPALRRSVCFHFSCHIRAAVPTANFMLSLGGRWMLRSHHFDFFKQTLTKS